MALKSTDMPDGVNPDKYFIRFCNATVQGTFASQATRDMLNTSRQSAYAEKRRAYKILHPDLSCGATVEERANSEPSNEGKDAKS